MLDCLLMTPLYLNSVPWDQCGQNHIITHKRETFFRWKISHYLFAVCVNIPHILLNCGPLFLSVSVTSTVCKQVWKPLMRYNHYESIVDVLPKHGIGEVWYKTKSAADIHFCLLLMCFRSMVLERCGTKLNQQLTFTFPCC